MDICCAVCQIRGAGRWGFHNHWTTVPASGDAQSEHQSAVHRERTDSAACKVITQTSLQIWTGYKFGTSFQTPEIKKKCFIGISKAQMKKRWTSIILLNKNGLFSPVRQQLEPHYSSQLPFSAQICPILPQPWRNLLFQTAETHLDSWKEQG